MSNALGLAGSATLNETSFQAELPRILSAIFLSTDEELSRPANDSRHYTGSLLDTLDNAFYNYNVDRHKLEQKRRRYSDSSVFTFFMGTDSYDGASKSNARGMDANFSNRLQELQMNWCETMDQLDCLLELDGDKASFVSLTLPRPLA